MFHYPHFPSSHTHTHNGDDTIPRYKQTLLFFKIPYFLFLKDNNRGVYYPGDVHGKEQTFLPLARYGSQLVVKDCDSKALKHLIFRKVA